MRIGWSYSGSIMYWLVSKLTSPPTWLISLATLGCRRCPVASEPLSLFRFGCDESGPGRHLRFRYRWVDGGSRHLRTPAARIDDLFRRYGAGPVRAEVARDRQTLQPGNPELATGPGSEGRGGGLQHQHRACPP